MPSGHVHVICSDTGKGLVWSTLSKGEATHEATLIKIEDLEALKIHSLFKVAKSGVRHDA